MDKIALARKKKRKLIKEQVKQNRINELWEEANRYADQKHLPKISKNSKTLQQVYKATKQVDSQVVVKSAVISLVCSIYVLLEKYDFDKSNVLTYATKLQQFIKAVISSERPISKLMEELKDEFDVDILNRCSIFHKLTENEIYSYGLEEAVILSTTNNWPYMVTLCVYSLVYDLNWSQDILNDFIDELNKHYKIILNDMHKLHEFKEKILNTVNVDIDLNSGLMKEIL